MKQFGGFGEVLDEIEKNVKQGVKQQVKSTVQAAKTQVGQKASSSQGSTGHPNASAGADASSEAGTNEAAQSGSQQPLQSDQATKDFVKDLYGPSTQQPHSVGQAGKGQQQSKFFQKQIAQGKTPEEAQRIEALRKRLHDETYYIPLTRRKPTEVEHKEEEQGKEQEKMQELQATDEKKKNETPLAVRMGSQRAEKYPGASG